MDQAVVTAVGVLFSISTLVLLALGLAIIFGMMGVLNLAQGEFLTLGAYTVLVATSHGLSIWAGILLAPFVVGSIGVILERSIIRFLYGRPLDTMLATWGLSLALVGVMTLVMGPTTGYCDAPRQFRSRPLRRLLLPARGDCDLRRRGSGDLFGASPHALWADRAGDDAVASSRGGLGRRAAARLYGYVRRRSGARRAGRRGDGPLTGVVPTMGLAFIAKIFITVMVGGSTVLVGTVSSAGVLGLVESAISYASTPIYGQVAMLALAMVLLRLLPNGMSGLFRGGL